MLFILSIRSEVGWAAMPDFSLTPTMVARVGLSDDSASAGQLMIFILSARTVDLFWRAAPSSRQQTAVIRGAKRTLFRPQILIMPRRSFIACVSTARSAVGWWGQPVATMLSSIAF